MNDQVMTLEEAMARIKELEAQIKANPRPYKDPYPHLNDILPYNLQNAFTDFFACMRKYTFEPTTVTLYRGKAKTDRAKRAIDLSNEEYAYYEEFCVKAFRLLKETVENWKHEEWKRVEK